MVAGLKLSSTFFLSTASALSMLTACGSKTVSHSTAIYGSDGQQLPDSEASSEDVDWVTLSPAVANYLHWNGVGSITPGCTATLLERPSDSASSAYLITAGHCVLQPGANADTILADVEASEHAALGRYVSDHGAPAAVQVDVDRVLYATMKNTDLAILQVDGISYQQLLARHVQPLALSAVPVHTGEHLLMPHTPLEGVSPRGLRLSRCTAGATVDLREDSHTFLGAFRNHCSSVGGTSGAPIIAEASGKIVGLLTTGTRQQTQGLPDCGDSRPCEVRGDQNGVTLPSENYGQHLQQVAACFAANGDFDLKAPGCGLEQPSSN